MTLYVTALDAEGNESDESNSLVVETETLSSTTNI